MSKVNTNPRFKCPDDHIETMKAGSLKNDTHANEKHWCTRCERFFYIHTWLGYRYFTNGINNGEIDFDLVVENGFTRKSDGAIVIIDDHN